MRKFAFTIVALALFSVFYPGLADAGMYGEVYIPDHEFVGFYDEAGVYTVLLVLRIRNISQYNQPLHFLLWMVIRDLNRHTS